MVLPLYKMIQQHLMTTINDPDLRKDTSGFKSGLKSGLKKITKHLETALVGDYPLLGAGQSFVSPKSFVY
jgi:hypothetical protein